MATNNKKLTFQLVLPSNLKKVGHLEGTNNLVFEGTLDSRDHYIVNNKLNRLAEACEDELKLPPGIDIRPMLQKAINDGQILGFLNESMNVPINNLVRDDDDKPDGVPMKPYTKAKRINDPTSPAVGEGFTNKD